MLISCIKLDHALYSIQLYCIMDNHPILRVQIHGDGGIGVIMILYPTYSNKKRQVMQKESYSSYFSMCHHTPDVKYIEHPMM